MIYYNTKSQEFYFPFNRNGSTLIYDISHNVNYLHEKNLDEALAILEENKNLPIYIPYRDPIVRFKSGLSVNFLRECGDETPDFTDVTKSAYHKYKIVLMTLRNYFQEHMSHHLLGKFILPFHLADVHIDHCLWRPLTLLVHGYNVKLIPMNELSSHLHKKFPTQINLIKSRERKNSFNTVRKDTDELWDIYKEVFIDIPKYRDKFGMQFVDWHIWMRDEQYIFEQFQLYRDSPNLNYAAQKIVTNLIEKKAYFSDTNSSMLPQLMFMLDEIRKHRDLFPELELFYNSYSQYIRGGTIIQRGDFINKRNKKKLLTTKRKYKIDII